LVGEKLRENVGKPLTGCNFMESYLKLLPDEKEAIDTFAFAQTLLDRGGDVERRFSLISLDNSFEIILRAYLFKKGVKKMDIDMVRKIDDLLWRCKKALRWLALR